MKFEDLNLAEPILQALENQNYSSPTRIQEQSIPLILEGHDVLGTAQTGTGKTAAFAIPIIQHLLKNNLPKKKKKKKKISALILSPTRELTIQIGKNFKDYTKYTSLKNAIIYGGTSQRSQVNVLRSGVDILIATPGRLWDLMNQGYISLQDVKYFVLDEADHMLDMGFIHDVKKIVKAMPKERQSLLFSATMPKNILDFSQQILHRPQKVTVAATSSVAKTIKQYIYFTNKENKKDLLFHILDDNRLSQVLLFARTKHGANRIVKNLNKEKIKSAAIHGDRSQGQRQKALQEFKDKKIRLLVATDIAARGIDIDKLTYVINYDIPNRPPTYIHRIGRCGRAGEEGISISICDSEERASIKKIEKLIKQKIQLVDYNPFPQTERPR